MLLRGVKLARVKDKKVCNTIHGSEGGVVIGGGACLFVCASGNVLSVLQQQKQRSP